MRSVQANARASTPDAQPTPLMRLPNVIRRTGLGRSTIYRLIPSGSDLGTSSKQIISRRQPEADDIQRPLLAGCRPEAIWSIVMLPTHLRGCALAFQLRIAAARISQSATGQL